MPFLTLEQAEIICDKTMEKAVELGFAPMTVAVFDAGGALRVLKQPDPANVTRPHMAMGKAWGAYAMGQPSRIIAQRHRRKGTQERGAGVGYLGEQRFRIFAGDVQMFRRELVGQPNRFLGIAHPDQCAECF